MMRNYKCLSTAIPSQGNFSLVPIRMEDRFKIMDWRNEQIYHLRQAKPLTITEQDIYFGTVVSALFDQEKPNQLLFSFLEEGKCIGYGGLVHINWNDLHAEISFIMNTAFEKTRFHELWSTYLKLLQSIAFDQLHFRKIYTYAFDIRPYLYSTLLDSGFIEEARLKEHCLIDGIYQDVLIHSLFNKQSKLFFLRPVTENDIDLFFKWANDPEVRQNSINTDPIPYDTHVQWFNNQLQNKESHLFVLSNGEEPAGQIRIQLNDGIWEIGYSISKDYRGKKLGYTIVQLLLNRFPEYRFKAIVKKNNIASIKVFEKLLFKLQTSSEDDTIYTFLK
ncbi:GNAT family N-acetyltransferase [Fluviicola sp.]|uniref:GNAT family N-acetyltransferase n=1 Tax=Fluviicola sp. TaxID=1917219 RepID=UPI003D2B4CDE